LTASADRHLVFSRSVDGALDLFSILAGRHAHRPPARQSAVSVATGEIVQGEDHECRRRNSVSGRVVNTRNSSPSQAMKIVRRGREDSSAPSPADQFVWS
jgi:hypothetical protein